MCAGIKLDKVQINDGDVVRIVVPDGNKSAVLRAVYSFDRKNWNFVKTQRASFDFDVPIEKRRKAVYFATFTPYFHSQMIESNKAFARSKYARLSRIASAPTVARTLNIAATLPEFALSFDSDGNLKTPDSMRKQGVDVLQGSYEYLKGLP